MKIKFEFEIADLTKAGEVQKYLKSINVSFNMSEAKSKITPRTRNFPKMTTEKADQILRVAKSHKNWSYTQVADTAGAGHEVTRKVLNGSHPILKGKLKAVK